ncbi:MAG: DinB family protein [Armatimonadetes bacterium]|nr:DinB family protein [Armatimonadota bacterium]
MSADAPSLMRVYEGWEGYNTSLVRAIAPCSPEQLAWRLAPHLRSAGEVAGHISLGRIDWFHRMNAPGSAELAAQVAPWCRGSDVAPESGIAENPAELVRWLEATWRMIEDVLTHWTVADLDTTYPHTYWGKTYAISRQWTIWRIMAHDIHHGGQLTEILGAQGITPLELAGLGGHLTEPPLAQPS